MEIVLLAAAGFFVVMALLVIGCSLWGAWRSTQAAGWPTTPARITNLELCEEPGTKGSVIYELKVQYSYAVAGVEYEGSRLAYGYGASTGREAHEEIRRKLKHANTVAARYDPSAPSVSCLSYGLHRSIQIQLAFAVIYPLCLLGTALYLWLSSQRYAVLLENLSVQ